MNLNLNHRKKEMTKTLLIAVAKTLAFIALITQLFVFHSQSHAYVLTFAGEPDESGLVITILLDGNTVFPPAELSSMIVNLVGTAGTAQTLQGMPAIAEKVAEKYKRAGYSKARVWVPEQIIRGGFITMKIDEGIETKEPSVAFFITLRSPEPARVEKPIRIIVPAALGSTVDVIARIIAGPLSKKVGPVIVENHPGGNGSVGLKELEGSKPDGYTFAVATVPSISTDSVIHVPLIKTPGTKFTPIVKVNIMASFQLIGPEGLDEMVIDAMNEAVSEVLAEHTVRKRIEYVGYRSMNLQN